MPGATSPLRRVRSRLVASALVAFACISPLVARAVGAEAASPPEPELHVPPSASEQDLASFVPGDPRRAQLLVDLALRRHAESIDLARGEQLEAEADTSAGPSRTRSTPRADALRAQAVAFALQAAEEAPAAPELPDALIVGGLDADRIGRGTDAARMLAMLIRRYGESRHVGDAWAAFAERHLRSGDLTRARAALDEAEQRGRPAVRAWAAARSAELALAVADLAGALRAIERAIEAGSPRAREVMHRIAAAATRGDPDDGVRNKVSELIERTSRAP